MEVCLRTHRRPKWVTRLEATPAHVATTQINASTITIKQEEENAGNPGPYWLTATDYESLYILRQQYTEHKEDKITCIEEILDEIDREQLELGRSIASFLKGFRPVDSYGFLIQFHPDAERRLIAQLLKGMKSYEVVHVMTNVILNRNNWTQSTSRSKDIKDLGPSLRT